MPKKITIEFEDGDLEKPTALIFNWVLSKEDRELLERIFFLLGTNIQDFFNESLNE